MCTNLSYSLNKENKREKWHTAKNFEYKINDLNLFNGKNLTQHHHFFLILFKESILC